MKRLFITLSALVVGCGTHSGKHAQGSESVPLELGGQIDAGSDTECGKILDGDLFDKVTQSGSSVERDLAQMRFFALSEQEAWNAYRQAKHDGSSGSGKLDVNVFDLVDLGASGSGGDFHDFNTFKEAFTQAKAEFNQYVSTDHYRNASDTYSSIVRDPASVQAWSYCIQQTSGAPKFRMVLQRQSKSEVLAQIYYTAGAFAGSLPQLKIDFTGGSPVGGGNGFAIGQGSKIFTLNVAADVEDVGVNGSTPDGNTNFSFLDRLPPTKDEFQETRCHLQNTLMLMARKMSLPVYNALEASSFVAFPVESAPQGHGSESCTSWLAGA